MRLPRFLSLVGLTAGALALVASPATALTTPDPDIRSFPNGPVCSGDTFSGVVRVSSTTTTAHPGRVELRYNAGGRAFTASGRVQPINVTKGNRDYSFKFNVADVPAGTVNLIAYAVVGSDPAAPIDTQSSRVVLKSSCAPAEVVPEAPAAALIPLTLAATAGAVVVVSRRRSAGAALGA